MHKSANDIRLILLPPVERIQAFEEHKQELRVCEDEYIKFLEVAGLNSK
jgi:hypothetical protein